jgi:hypothetical protein
MCFKLHPTPDELFYLMNQERTIEEYANYHKEEEFVFVQSKNTYI